MLRYVIAGFFGSTWEDLKCLVGDGPNITINGYTDGERFHQAEDGWWDVNVIGPVTEDTMKLVVSHITGWPVDAIVIDAKQFALSV